MKHICIHLPIKIHPLFFMVGIISVFFNNFGFFLIYTLSVVLHELGHAFVAKKRGYKMDTIKLMPYGAVLFGETDEFTPKDEYIIALAGPLTNLLLSVVCIASWWLFPSLYSFTLEFCVASLIAGVFNLLPVFPLDGGRVVLGFLSSKMDRKLATKIVKIITVIFSILLFILFLFSFFLGFNMSIGIAAVLLFANVITDAKDSSYKRISSLFDRKRQIIRGIEQRVMQVGEDTKLRVLVSKIERGKITIFHVLNENGKLIKIISEDDLKQLIQKYRFSERVGDIVI